MKKHLRLMTAAFAVLALALVGCDEDNGLDDGLNGDGIEDNGLEDDGLDDDGLDDDLDEDDDL